MELAFLNFENDCVKIEREKFRYLSEAFLAAGISETPNRRKILEEATYDKPYMVKSKKNKYCVFLPDGVEEPGVFCGFIEKCIVKAREKNAKSK